MKLGEMQIHRAILGVMATEEEYQAYQGDDVIVEYVLFSDAQAKSLADERRINQLEEVLRTIADQGPPEYGETRLHAVCALARAALRVETQEEGK